MVPWALSAISIPYNLPGIKCVVRLTPAVLSGIYLGEITKWNDPKITQNNGTCNLPDLKITPVYRSDNSGTSYAFTDYLSNVNGDVEVEVRHGRQRPVAGRRRCPRKLRRRRRRHEDAGCPDVRRRRLLAREQAPGRPRS